MRILSITAGAGGMYCGSCLQDNAQASELIARGHDVTLIPLYTPLLTDEANVTRPNVLFGGINVYLQQHSSLFRRMPRFVDRLIDSPRVITAFASRSVSVDPKLLGDLTISMLEGADGVLRKEFDKLLEWVSGEPKPDVVSITNSMLLGLARPIAAALGRPICCALQGEDLFLEGLTEPYKGRALDLIRRHVGDVDRFVAVSNYYATFMKDYLRIPADRISVVPLGVNLRGFERRESTSDDVFRVGYFARVAPEKGLLQLAQAFIKLRQRVGDSPIRLEAAGYLAPNHKGYLDDVRRTLAGAGVLDNFRYRGAVDRDGKAAFLREVDVLSVPTLFDDSKGLPLLEAMACGVPVVQPRRGSFTEIVEKTGGGLLVRPNDVDSLVEGLHTLWRDRSSRAELGRRGYEGVRQHYTIQRAVDTLLRVYESAMTGGALPAQASGQARSGGRAYVH
jgi:glycosyltransferase involved in cell wall biosynthesis